MDRIEGHSSSSIAPGSVGIALPGEIERVAAKRERWRGMAKAGPADSLGPGIALMTIAIDKAKDALAGDDVVWTIRAFQALQSFDSED